MRGRTVEFRRAPAMAALLGIVAILCGAGCAWNVAPREQDALLPPVEVKRPLSDQTQAALMLTRQGVWALLDRSTDKNLTRDLKPGQLIMSAPTREDAEGDGHLFAVLLVRSWGAVLQRLDARPLESGDGVGMASVYVMPVAGMQAAGLRRLGACVGQGDPATSRCVQEAAPGARLDIWPLDDRGQLKPREIDDTRYTLALPRAAMALRHATGARVITADPDKKFTQTTRWIALPQPGPYRLPPRVTITADTSCQRTPWDAHLSVGVAARGELGARRHVLGFEEAALKHGADALVWCDKKGAPELAIPTLTRLSLRASDGGFMGAPVLGAQRTPMGELAPWRLARALEAAAATSAGDHHLAAFLFESALGGIKPDHDLDPLALHAMQIVAAGGAPEAALRMGWVASQSAWNRDESPIYQLGLIAAYGATGRARDRMSAESSLGKYVSRHEKEPISHWLRWREVHRQLDTEQIASADSLKRLEAAFDGPDQELWALTLRAGYIVHTGLLRPEQASKATRPDEAPTRDLEAAFLEAAFTKNKLPTVYAALHDQLPDQPCDVTKGCALDAAGTRLREAMRASSHGTPAQRRALLDALRRRPLSLLPRSDASGAHSRAKNSAESLLIQLAFIATSAPESTQHLGLSTARLAGELLGDPTTRPTLCKAPHTLRTARALGQEIEATLRLRGILDPSTLERFAAWLGARGVQAACEGPTALIDAATTLARRAPESADLTLRMAEALLRHQTSPQDARALLDAAAAFAAKHAAGPRCERWSLSLASAQLLRHDLDGAQRHLLSALNCGRRAARAHQVEADVVGALIHYERTGAINANLSDEAQGVLRNARRTPFAPICPALGTGRLRVERALAPDRMALLRALPRPAPAPADAIQLLTTSAALAQADTLLTRAGELLQRGDVPQAARLLRDARARYARGGDPAGVFTVDLVEAQLLGGSLDALITPADAPAATPSKNKNNKSDKKTPPSTLDQLRAGRLNDLYKGEGFTATQRLAMSLLTETPDHQLGRLKAMPAQAREAICKQ